MLIRDLVQAAAKPSRTGPDMLVAYQIILSTKYRDIWVLKTGRQIEVELTDRWCSDDTIDVFNNVQSENNYNTSIRCRCELF